MSLFQKGDLIVNAHHDDSRRAGAIGVAVDEEGREESFPFRADTGIREQFVSKWLRVREQREQLFARRLRLLQEETQSLLCDDNLWPVGVEKVV